LKQKLFYFFEKLAQNKTILSFLVRKIFKESKFISLENLIKLNALARPQYAYCAYYSALLAKKLSYDKISFIEFGVAKGNGLIYLENLAARIEKELNIKVEIYGFDTGEGLIKPEDYRDLPYFFEGGMYKMDINKLQQRTNRSKLIIGDVKNTVKNFFTDYKPAKIAAIFNDLDYYSSTINSFNFFKSDVENFLPRVFCYFDDVVGSAEEMYSEFSGELLAINEFNNLNENSKFSLNTNLQHLDLNWKNQIYYLHHFKHSKYNVFIDPKEQIGINNSISLK
jgi:hypothetical protein|tara:strand:- start:2439 stop:3281 length:843 start_codon:yes stop_codon:yes gene_type:complete